MNLRHAYYSAEAEKWDGSQVWLDHNGKEVIVTRAGHGLLDYGMYLWPDRKSVGPVVSWVRTHVEPPAIFQKRPARYKYYGHPIMPL